MPKFTFETKGPIKIGPNPGDTIRNYSFSTEIFGKDLTATNLFSFSNRAKMVNVLNMHFKTSFFNETNIQNVSTSFRIKKL